MGIYNRSTKEFFVICKTNKQQKIRKPHKNFIISFYFSWGNLILRQKIEYDYLPPLKKN